MIQDEHTTWARIEELGGTIWFLEHEMADGRLDSSPEIISKLSEMRDEINAAVSDACDRFHIIHPRDYPERGSNGELPPAPDGYEYYWDWYNRMKYGDKEEEK